MKYRKLGNSGVLVSSLSLGTMQFGRAMKMGSLDQDQTDRMVRFAIDGGINLIDTADVYSLGESETLVGASLRGIRDQVDLGNESPVADERDRLQSFGCHPTEPDVRGRGKPASPSNRPHRSLPDPRLGQPDPSGRERSEPWTIWCARGRSGTSGCRTTSPGRRRPRWGSPSAST